MAQAEKDTAGVIALPPLILGGFLVVGLALDYFLPSGVRAGVWHFPLGAALVLAGIALGLLGERRLHGVGTNVSPLKPTTAIATDGIYRYTRNPLYLALTLIMLGIACLANGLWTLLLVVPFVAVIRYGVIAREETYLDRKFGDAYRDYKTRVRRWF